MTTSSSPKDLAKFAWLSIAAAIATISLKTCAYLISGSVGLLSDACESTVNLVAAVVALIALHTAAKPADTDHHYGHTKAEYISAAIEGQMIFVAAVAILWSACNRLLNPEPLENVGLGLLINFLASIINGAVAWVLLRAGKKHNSMTLSADGKHLLTDVWTSGGVIAGVGLVSITALVGWDCWWLDPVVAILVGLNIIWAGWELLKDSANALLDASMEDTQLQHLMTVLGQFLVPNTVEMHGLRTRIAGHQTYVEMHLLVPGKWTVTQGHDLCEEIEAKVSQEFPHLDLTIHLEPLEDPRARCDEPTASLQVK